MKSWKTWKNTKKRKKWNEADSEGKIGAKQSRGGVPFRPLCLSPLLLLKIFLIIHFVDCEFSHFPIIFHIRHTGIWEVNRIAYLPIRAEQWSHTDFTTEVTLLPTDLRQSKRPAIMFLQSLLRYLSSFVITYFFF